MNNTMINKIPPRVTYHLFRQILLFIVTVTLFLPTESSALATGLERGKRSKQESATGWDVRFGGLGLEGNATVSVTALAFAENGDLYVGGDFQRAGGVDAAYIARWDGVRWHPLGKGLDGVPRALVTDGNTLYVIGNFASAGNIAANQLARWDGAKWSTVGTGKGAMSDLSTARVEAIAFANGKLTIGGSFKRVDGVEATNIAQWDGSRWSALGKGVGQPNLEGGFSDYGSVFALLADGDELYVGGDIGMAGDTLVNGIAHWDGSQWSALGTGLTDDGANYNEWATINVLAKGNGKLYAAGIFTRAGDVAANNIAMWQGGQWQALGDGVLNSPDGITMPINTLLADGDTLYAGGSFLSIGGESIALFARWQNGAWSKVGSGHDNFDGFDSVKALAKASDGTIYSGGYHSFVGGKRVDHLARWDGAQWLSLNNGLLGGFADASPAEVRAMIEDENGHVFAAGKFSFASGAPVRNLAMLENGVWRDIGGSNDRIYALALDTDYLYVGGAFTEIGGIAANRIARWHRATGQWSTLGSGVNNPVLALHVANGVLYAGGSFTNAGVVAASNVAWWDGSTWHAFGERAVIRDLGVNYGEGTWVNAIAVYGNLVFVGGSFTSIHYGDRPFYEGFVTVNSIVAWDRTTDQWYLLGSAARPGVLFPQNFELDNGVNALKVVGNRLFVGGKFNQAGSLASTGLAIWDLRNSQWLPFSAGIGGAHPPHVYTLAQVDHELIVGGKFLQAGNAGTVNHIARFDLATETWSAFDGGVTWFYDHQTVVYSLAASNRGLYVGGQFDSAGGVSALGFARWNGTLGGGQVPEQPPLPSPDPNVTAHVYLPLVLR